MVAEAEFSSHNSESGNSGSNINRCLPSPPCIKMRTELNNPRKAAGVTSTRVRKMTTPATIAVDGNEAAARVAYRLSEVIGIYPITPSSPMAELADQWSALRQPNLWGSIPKVVAMQSEGGAAGTLHGALQTGALATTFTASQGLLLMVPNMYKIAGELTSAVFHIAARSIATHALSIFGDHSDVMATRSTGWGILFSASVQEAMDLALVAHASTLEARIPFLHVFDGFRTSHEIQKITPLDDSDLRALVDERLVHAHRQRALSPDHPVVRGTAQNPDTFFQSREAANPFYLATPEIVQRKLEELGARTGRPYRLFDYVGAPDAERVLVLMGSGCETAEETVAYLANRGEKVGALKIRLYRPFSIAHFLEVLPETTRLNAALDRTKELGSLGEPLYQDVLTAVSEGDRPIKVLGGRYGLGSKEFNPAMIHGIFQEMNREAPKRHFTIGIHDDVTQTSLNYDPSFDTEAPGVTRAMFWGLGSDGTVGANKNTIKIIAESTDKTTQGYFVYDSKKAGARTVSHLRFGQEPIHSTYLIQRANFIAVHQFSFLERFDTLASAEDGATLLLNCPFEPSQVWERLPRKVQQQIQEKGLRLHVIDAYQIARSLHLGMRINTVMQTCFFHLSQVLESGDAVNRIKDAIRKSYGKRGELVVKRNFAAVDAALENLHPVDIPATEPNGPETPALIPADAPEFVRRLTAPMLIGEGDALPVSAFPPDGTYPSGTTRWEKRAIAQEVPVWEPDLCIQCGKCVLVCPHAVIRAKVCEESQLNGAPMFFQHSSAKWRDLPEKRFTLQVAPDDCTGCSLCVEICPAKDKSQAGRKAINMTPRATVLEAQRSHWDFFQQLPTTNQANGTALDFHTVKDIQLLEPLFEFSGACAGCGETPYLKLLSQLYGDRLLIANATGCSSIYGGNLPTTPWTKNEHGRGPAWSNSLFEDNAEFGLGMRLALDAQTDFARHLLTGLRDSLEPGLVDAILQAPQDSEQEIAGQRTRVGHLKESLANHHSPEAADLFAVADTLVRKDVWIVGGDGWAYDIGFGGLDHLLASEHNVNVLVMDTEVYSNTGGQASKSTSLGSVAKFASGGKRTPKKDLGMMAMHYGHVYVAQVAMGASDSQTVNAFREAAAHPGPSLIIAYSHCIAHGIDMSKGMDQQKLAAQTGYWLLYRYNPRLWAEKRNPLKLDSPPPKRPLRDYFLSETRFRILHQADPSTAAQLLNQAQEHVLHRRETYEDLLTISDPALHDTES